MKKILFLSAAICLLAYTHLHAQTREGKITYEQKINIHKRMPPEAEQFKAMVPEFQTNILELYFTETQSLFKPAKEQGDQLPTAEGGGGGMGRGFMRFGGMGGNAETFRDYDKEMIIESRELGPKKYLIEDTLRPLKWKLEAETMTINGFECRKATTTIQGFGMGGMRMGGSGGAQGTGRRADSSITRILQEPQQVVAWYTEQIETAAGPDSYFGLPGLILYLDIDDGTIVFSPKKLEPLGEETVKAPTKGNKITREEYRKLMQQQFQGMGGRPGGGSMMIRQ